MSAEEQMYVDALKSKIAALEATVEHLELVVKLRLPIEGKDDA